MVAEVRAAASNPAVASARPNAKRPYHFRKKPHFNLLAKSCCTPEPVPQASTSDEPRTSLFAKYCGKAEPKPAEQPEEPTPEEPEQPKPEDPGDQEEPETEELGDPTPDGPEEPTHVSPLPQPCDEEELKLEPEVSEGPKAEEATCPNLLSKSCDEEEPKPQEPEEPHASPLSKSCDEETLEPEVSEKVEEESSCHKLLSKSCDEEEPKNQKPEEPHASPLSKSCVEETLEPEVSEKVEEESNCHNLLSKSCDAEELEADGPVAMELEGPVAMEPAGPVEMEREEWTQAELCPNLLSKSCDGEELEAEGSCSGEPFPNLLSVTCETEELESEELESEGSEVAEAAEPSGEPLAAGLGKSSSPVVLLDEGEVRLRHPEALDVHPEESFRLPLGTRTLLVPQVLPKALSHRLNPPASAAPPASPKSLWYDKVLKGPSPLTHLAPPRFNLMTKSLTSPALAQPDPPVQPETCQQSSGSRVPSAKKSAYGSKWSKSWPFGRPSDPARSLGPPRQRLLSPGPSLGPPRQRLLSRRSVPDLKSLASCCEEPTEPSKEDLSEDALRRLCTTDFGGAKFVDTHCHLDFLFQKGKEDWGGSLAAFKRSRRWAEWFGPSFGGLVMDLCEPRTWRRGGADKWAWEALAREEGVWTAVGCHPHFAGHWSDEVGAEMRALLTSQPGFVAVGECGLDYSGRNPHSRETQQRAFRAQAALARELGKPLVVHCRGARRSSPSLNASAEEECLQTLVEVLGRGSRLPIHRHCFQGSLVWARRWVEAFPNIRFGMNPNISRLAPELVAGLEVERMLIETDAPFFVPAGLRKRLRSSAPAFGIVVAHEIANAKGLPVPHVLHKVMDNFHAVYGVRPN